MLRLMIFLAFAILGCQAACNECSSTTGHSCISATEFQFCSSSSVAIGTTYTCPTGYYCTDSAILCSSDSSLVSCSGCNKCSSDNRFACTSRNTFALCLGSATPSTSLGGTCGPNYVCNVNEANICVDPTQYPTTCWSSSTGNCGSTTITDANEYCRGVGTIGRYPYGGVTSTTCKQYVYCYVVSGVFYGNVYSCPGATYFDSTTQQCTTATQARCSDSVQCLTLNNRVLP